MFGACFLLILSILQGIVAYFVWIMAKSSIHEILAAVITLNSSITFCSAFVVRETARSRRKIIAEIKTAAMFLGNRASAPAMEQVSARLSAMSRQ